MKVLLVVIDAATPHVVCPAIRTGRLRTCSASRMRARCTRRRSASFPPSRHEIGPHAARDVVDRVDAMLGEAFDAAGGIDRLLADTCVILTSDHGHCDVVADVGGASHGALHALDSLSPVIMAGGPLAPRRPRHLRSVDIAPLCMQLLGLPMRYRPGAPRGA